MHIVVALETASDFPGVIGSWGPFATYEEASKFADDTATSNGVFRGEHIQISLLESPKLGSQYGLFEGR